MMLERHGVSPVATFERVVSPSMERVVSPVTRSSLEEVKVPFKSSSTREMSSALPANWHCPKMPELRSFHVGCGQIIPIAPATCDEIISAAPEQCRQNGRSWHLPVEEVCVIVCQHDLGRANDLYCGRIRVYEGVKKCIRTRWKVVPNLLHTDMSSTPFSVTRVRRLLSPARFLATQRTAPEKYFCRTLLR